MPQCILVVLHVALSVLGAWEGLWAGKVLHGLGTQTVLWASNKMNEPQRAPVHDFAEGTLSDSADDILSMLYPHAGRLWMVIY